MVYQPGQQDALKVNKFQSSQEVLNLQELEEFQKKEEFTTNKY